MTNPETRDDDPTQDDKDWDEYIKGEKQKYRSNVKRLFPEGENPNIELPKGPISPDTLRNALEPYVSPDANNLIFTNLSTCREQAKITQTIEQGKNLSTPEDIVLAIGNFLKQSLAYDGFYDLYALMHSKQPDFTHFLNNKSITVLPQIKQLIPLLQSAPDSASKEAFLKLLNGNDSQAIKHYIADNYKSGSDFKKMLLNVFTNNRDSIRNTLTYNGISDIQDQLDLKVGTCREFAMICKRIYEFMKKKISAIFPHSEMIYIINPEDGHAYNMLIYKDAEGAIHKRYYDLSSYALGSPIEYAPLENTNILLQSLKEEIRAANPGAKIWQNENFSV